MDRKGLVVIAGGDGFLGRAVQSYLIEQGYRVAVLVRRPGKFPPDITQAIWDGKSIGDWARLFDGAYAVINLVGRTVNCIYNEKNKREIIDSRVNSVKVIGEAIALCATPPKVWVQSGSLAIFGDPGERICDDNSPLGTGFSAEVCKAWERAFDEAVTPSTRKVYLRIGIALGQGGGIMAPFMRLTKCFLGGTVGSGRQYISWVHIEDLHKIILWALERDEMHGKLNATGPIPARNQTFMRELRRVCHRPWSPPVPKPVVQFGARWVMRTEPELALTGRGCVPSKLLELGFKFRYPDLGPALSVCVDGR